MTKPYEFENATISLMAMPWVSGALAPETIPFI